MILTIVGLPWRAAIMSSDSLLGPTVFTSRPRLSRSATVRSSSLLTAWTMSSNAPAVLPPQATRSSAIASQRPTLCMRRPLVYVEQAKEVGAGGRSHLFQRDSAQPGDLLGHVLHQRGLVGLPAVGHRREVGRIGFDQHALQRHLTRDLPQRRRVLEGDDPGKGDVEAQRQRRARDLPGAREAMHDAAHLPGALLVHDAQGILGRLPHMDDERLAAATCGADMGAEALALPFGIALDAVVIQPGFPDRND